MTGVMVADTAGGVRVAVTGAGPGVFRWKEAEAALGESDEARGAEGLRSSRTISTRTYTPRAPTARTWCG